MLARLVSGGPDGREFALPGKDGPPAVAAATATAAAIEPAEVSGIVAASVLKGLLGTGEGSWCCLAKRSCESSLLFTILLCRDGDARRVT